MFNIYDGREHFFQWDLQQKLIVNDESINEVHFCNKTDDCSLVVKVEEYEGDRVANVPNILLQDSWTIHAYAFAANYTKVEQCFKVVPRSKPADYIYTETEVATLEKMEQAIDRIEENIGEVARDYLTENKEELLSGFATEDYVSNTINEALAAKGYATEEDVAGAVKGLATEAYVTEAVKDLATETYVTESIEEALSEYVPEVPETGGGASSWDELTNKPFYSEATETILYENNEIAIDSTNDGTSQYPYYQSVLSGWTQAKWNKLKTDKAYYVTYEGNEYQCRCIFDGDNRYLGNLSITNAKELDTKENFLVKFTKGKILTGGDSNYTYNAYIVLKDKPTSGKDYSLKIVELDSLDKVKTLDERFIPATIARTDDLAGYASMEQVEEKGYITMAQVTAKGYTTLTEVEAKGYQTAAQVNTLISEALGVIENGAY